MEEIIKYEDRDNLYKFLIGEFGFEKIEEKDDSKSFGNFRVILSGRYFLLRYLLDRSYLAIEIASKYDIHWYDLSFIRDLLYNPDSINAREEKLSNKERIYDLNNFLKQDYSRINELFTEGNYSDTKTRLNEGLKKHFF
jgi:hypothetical protein